jgi:hypothetical protein
MDLSTRQKQKLQRLWKSDSLEDEICDEMGFSEAQLAAAAAQMKLPYPRQVKVYIPTPEQIMLAKTAIKSQWTQVERDRRIDAAHRVE